MVPDGSALFLPGVKSHGSSAGMFCFPVSSRVSRAARLSIGSTLHCHVKTVTQTHRRASTSRQSSSSALEKDWLNVPNALTLARLAAIPGIMLSWYSGAPGVAAVLFGAAAATDFLDGYLARRWGQSTPLGALLDPLADKLLVSSALLLLVEHSSCAAVTVPAVAILGRELAVSSLREWMQVHRAEAAGKVSVAWHGKAKAVLQLLALQVMLGGIAFTDPAKASEGGTVYDGGVILLWIAAAITVASGAQYARIALCAI
ncbi:unnamed protein product [Polarella glacialis]|uniref:CDP-diacylglycerol--glycerol-3-phosphate 3-phosphatidyltransferase n=1 Tax=Polarella glacialis TaxID=89957 RepID=A0A813IR33_POLGL|nr:unnamed protein product [Polarella glacialis]